MRQVPPRRSKSSRGLSYHEPFETSLGDSMGGRELQGTPESLLDERFQDSSTARKVRDRKKTGLSLHGKSHAAKNGLGLPLLMHFFVMFPRIGPANSVQATKAGLVAISIFRA